ncbi:mitochondrial glutathione transporter SLC25A40-like [Centruroides vittatus]|uniref:mitochondrial glutathione transporter SLC25A40-like n=1 Tax=Centruroides vittatus TaxID=120091 RepID=UPI00350F5547
MSEKIVSKSSKKTNSITPTQQMISSCAGAFITSVFVTPLDVVKIRLQAQQKEFLKRKCFLYCNGLMEHTCFCPNNGTQMQWYQRPGHFTGTVDALIKISRNEGMFSLWSGLPPTLVMAIPATVVYFTMYDQIRERLTNYFNRSSPPLWIPAVAGSLARVVSVSVISPLELIRTKMQSKKYSYVELTTAVKMQVQAEGIGSLYRGWVPTILRDVPFSAIYWGAYESFKHTYNQQKPATWFSFMAGAISGTIAAILTLPFDVIKTHRQIELGEIEALKTSSKQANASTYELMKNLYQKRGPTALFAGLVPRVVKVAPACAIMITTYESGKKFFYKYNKKHKR